MKDTLLFGLQKVPLALATLLLLLIGGEGSAGVVAADAWIADIFKSIKSPLPTSMLGWVILVATIAILAVYFRYRDSGVITVPDSGTILRYFGVVLFAAFFAVWAPRLAGLAGETLSPWLLTGSWLLAFGAYWNWRGRINTLPLIVGVMPLATSIMSLLLPSDAGFRAAFWLTLGGLLLMGGFYEHSVIRPRLIDQLEQSLLEVD